MTTTTFEEVVAFAVDIVARSCGPTFTDLDVEQLRTRQAAVLDGVAGTDEAVSLAKWADAVAETLGIDLATATRADGWRLSAFYGARMGDKH